MKSGPSTGADNDQEQLRALGYSSDFERTMTLWENFALGFTYLSPVVGVYSVFAFGLATGGPPMIWSYFIAAAGQFLVCLVFCEVVAQFPISGGAYPWARRLVGKRWAWMTGWVYMWALFTSVAGVSVGAGPFLAHILGFAATPQITTLVALGLVLLSTILNMSGTSLLARVAMFGFICELIGAIVVGGYLLLFHRYHSPAILVDSMGIRQAGAYWPAFLAASLTGLFTCYGFEACGDVAEETPDPGRAIPRAMRMTIYVGMSASVFVCVALLLATPDLAGVIKGTVANPVEGVLNDAFGSLGAKAVILVVMVSFISCILSLQAAVSRLLFSFARDGMIVGSGFLGVLSEKTKVPTRALVVSGIVPGLIVCLGLFVQDALTTIVSFAVIGIYVAFQMIVLGALIARSRGWKPGGKFKMGRWAVPVNVAALIYGVGALLNLLWPRATAGAPWYVSYANLLTVAVVAGAGGVYMLVSGAHDRGAAPAGDAADLTRAAALAQAPAE